MAINNTIDPLGDPGIQANKIIDPLGDPGSQITKTVDPLGDPGKETTSTFSPQSELEKLQQAKPLEENWLKLMPAELKEHALQDVADYGKQIAAGALPFAIGEKIVGKPKGIAGQIGYGVGTLASFAVPGAAAGQITKIPAMANTLTKIANIPKYGKFLSTAVQHLVTTGATFGLQGQIQTPVTTSIKERAKILGESEFQATLFGGVGVLGATGGKIGKGLTYPAMFGIGYETAGADANPVDKFISGAILVFLHAMAAGKPRKEAETITAETVKEQYKVDDIKATEMVKAIIESPEGRNLIKNAEERIRIPLPQEIIEETPDARLARMSRGETSLAEAKPEQIPPEVAKTAEEPVLPQKPIEKAAETPPGAVKTGEGIAGQPPVKSPFDEAPNMTTAYTRAEKQADGTWKLLFLGTSNEVFPNERFKSATEAKQYFNAEKERARQQITEQPPEAGVKPTEKEPWELTFEQWKAQHPENRSAIFEGSEFHHDLVKEVLAANKPVPPEVLKEYPDLSPPAPTTPEKIETPPPAKTGVTGAQKIEEAEAGAIPLGAAVAGGEEFQPPMTIKKPRIGFAEDFITEPFGSITGLRNSQIERERKQYGLPPAMDKIKKSDPQAWNEAMQTLEKNPNAGQELVDSLSLNPRPATKPENALLLRRLVEINIEHNKAATETHEAAKSGDPIWIRDANLLYEKATEQHTIIADVLDRTGTLTAQALQSRKLFSDEEYNLATMELHQIAATGQKKLTPEQRGEIKRIHDEYAKKVSDLNAKVTELEKQRKSEQDVVEQTDETVVMKDLEKKAITKTTKESGEGKKPDFEGDKQKAIEKIQDTVESGEESEISDLQDPIQKLALYFEQKDIDLHGKSTLGFREIVKGVHSIVKRIIPTATYEEVRDAISGYGKVRYPSKDAAKTALRKHKSEILKVAPLETVQKNIATLKEEGKSAEKELAETKHTGYQRDQIEAKARDLQKKLASAMKEQDRLMKELGIETGDPAKRLKTALDAKKTRLTNQIEDINRAITEHKELVRNKGLPVDDAETKALEAERDRRMAEYKEIFPDQPMTDQERLDRAIKTAERSLADWNERVANAEKGIFPTKEPGKPLPESERLSTLNREREVAKAEVKRLHDLAFPPLTPEEAALATFKKRTTTTIEKLQTKIDTLDFSKPVRKEIVLDEEGFKLKRDLEKVKQEWQAILEKERLKNRTWTQKVWDYGTEPFNVARSLLASFDLSAVGRQGWFVGAGHPIMAAKNIPTMLRSFASEYQTYKVDQEIRSRPTAPLYSKAKLELTELGGKMTRMEETFMSKISGKVPGIKQSQRAYVTYLNKLRADSFDAMVKSMARTGAPTDAELKALGNYINVATGRGNLGKVAGDAQTLATIFWSPRLFISRFQLLAGEPLYHGSARTRKLIAGEYGRFLIGIGVFYSLAKLTGAEIEVDSRSSDFGKIKFGNTRIDPMAGLSQTTVFVARILSGEKKTAGGRIMPIRGEKQPFGSTAWDVTTSFLRSKLSPLIGTSVDVATGETVVGEKVTPVSAVTRNLVPLAFNDIYETMAEQGVPKGTIMTLLSIFGFGVQTYDNQRREVESAIERLITRIKIINRQKQLKSSQSNQP